MKIIGAVLIVLSGLFLGLAAARTLKKREQALLAWKQWMQDLRSEIGYASRPLSELIDGGDSPFCTQAVKEIGFSGNPCKALEKAGEKFFWNSGDLELFQSFVRKLGCSGLQEQLEHIELYNSLLQTRLEYAQEDREKKARLYISLGLFAGLSLCVVLM